MKKLFQLGIAACVLSSCNPVPLTVRTAGGSYSVQRPRTDRQLAEFLDSLVANTLAPAEGEPVLAAYHFASYNTRHNLPIAYAKDGIDMQTGRRLISLYYGNDTLDYVFKVEYAPCGAPKHPWLVIDRGRSIAVFADTGVVAGIVGLPYLRNMRYGLTACPPRFVRGN